MTEGRKGRINQIFCMTFSDSIFLDSGVQMLPRQVMSRFQPFLEKIRDQVHWRETSKFGKKNTASMTSGLGFINPQGAAPPHTCFSS